MSENDVRARLREIPIGISTSHTEEEWAVYGVRDDQKGMVHGKAVEVEGTPDNLLKSIVGLMGPTPIRAHSKLDTPLPSHPMMNLPIYRPLVEHSHAKPFRGKANLQGTGLIPVESTPDLIVRQDENNNLTGEQWYYVGTYDGVAYYNRVERWLYMFKNGTASTPLCLRPGVDYELSSIR